MSTDLSDDEDVEHIVVEFPSNSTNFENLENLVIYGLEEKEPILKLDNKFYKITIENSIGTRLIFNRDQFYTKTDKIATAQRVLVKQPETPRNSKSSATCDSLQPQTSGK